MHIQFFWSPYQHNAMPFASGFGVRSKPWAVKLCETVHTSCRLSERRFWSNWRWKSLNTAELGKSCLFRRLMHSSRRLFLCSLTAIQPIQAGMPNCKMTWLSRPAPASLKRGDALELRQKRWERSGRRIFILRMCLRGQTVDSIQSGA